MNFGKHAWLRAPVSGLVMLALLGLEALDRLLPMRAYRRMIENDWPEDDQ